MSTHEQLAQAYRARRESIEVGVYALVAVFFCLLAGSGLLVSGSPLLAVLLLGVGLGGLVWQAGGVLGAVREVYWDA